MENTPSSQIKVHYDEVLSRWSSGLYVYKGRFAERDVAVKVIYKVDYQFDVARNFVRKLDIRKIKHPNVIEILECEVKDDVMQIAMEVCDQALDVYLDKNDLNVAQTHDVLWQCAKGLSYLHENDHCIAVMRPNNFWIKREDSRIILKVCYEKDINALLESETNLAKSYYQWFAPERFGEFERIVKTDRFTISSLKEINVFSFALIILYTCLTKEGKCDKHVLGRDVKLGKDVLAFFSHQWRSDSLKQMMTPLLKKMLSRDAKSRPSMREVCDFFDSKILSDQNQPSYPMKSIPRGYAIVINMRFSGDDEAVRKGSEVDVSSLTDLFNRLQFCVEVHQDLTRTELLRALDDISHREELADHDAFILAVMSHGGEDYIVAADRQRVPVNDIITRFSNNMCTRLKDKPKVIIVQSCRGDKEDHGVTVSRDAVPKTYKISCTADILVAYATPSGYVAWRDDVNGSWFIQTLVKVFEERADDTQVSDMLTEVCRVVNEKYESHEGYKMCPEFTSRLRFPLFLKP